MIATEFELFNASRDFRNRLLARTLRHAAEFVPKYRDKFAGLERVQTIEDLSNLPITHKSEFIDDPVGFRDPTLDTAAVQHTGGSTGSTLLVHRSSSELEFIEKFFLSAFGQECESEKGISRLCISMYGNLHGESPQLPFPGKIFRLDYHDNFWDIQTLVSNPSKIFGRNFDEIILSGFESQLRLFSARLVESNFNFDNSNVRAIFSTGDHVSRRMQRWYANHWQVPFVNRYGMTEFFGGARRCSRCGFFHFEPHLIGEIIDLKSGAVTKEGEYGSIVVTALHPFVQKQPIIRYWTGDLAKRAPNCPADEFGFEFGGRISTCIIDPESSQPFIVSAELYDALDEYPELAHSKQFSDIGDVIDHSALGYLKFQLETKLSNGKLASIKLRCETRFSPHMYPERSSQLVSELTDKILDCHPRLFQHVQEGLFDFSIELEPPGSLSNMMVAQIE